MDLTALQRAFQQHLLHGDAAITAQLRQRGGPSLARRLHIYHHAYRARLVDALRESFGHSARYLGDDWFERDARAYVEAHPSDSPNLNDYGASLPDWWAARYPQDADIAELARLDWALRRAFDAADTPPLTLAALSALPPAAWAEVGFRLQPAAQRLRFTHNTLALWQALDADEVPPAASALPAPGEVLVWRVGTQPHFRSLAPLEAAALALLPSLSFAALCTRLAADFPGLDVPVQAGTLLRRWVDDGLLCAPAP